jgi:hypothetical protein
MRAPSMPLWVRIDGSSVGASRLPSHAHEGLWTVVLTGSMCRPLLELISAQPGHTKARQSYSTPWSAMWRMAALIGREWRRRKRGRR